MSVLRKVIRVGPGQEGELSMVRLVSLERREETRATSLSAIHKVGGEPDQVLHLHRKGNLKILNLGASAGWKASIHHSSGSASISGSNSLS